MMTAEFFTTHGRLKKMMNIKFKTKGYNLTFKKRFLKATLGYVPTLKDMTISEMETVINALDAGEEKRA